MWSIVKPRSEIETIDVLTKKSVKQLPWVRIGTLAPRRGTVDGKRVS